MAKKGCTCETSGQRTMRSKEIDESIKRTQEKVDKLRKEMFEIHRKMLLL